MKSFGKFRRINFWELVALYIGLIVLYTRIPVSIHNARTIVNAVVLALLGLIFLRSIANLRRG